MTGQSVHVQSWPKPSGLVVDRAGAMVKEIAGALRRYKAEKGAALNAPLPGIVVYSALDLETFDLKGVANSPVEARRGRPELEMRAVAAEPSMKIIGPLYRDRSGKIIQALKAMDPREVERQRAAGSVRVELDGKVLEVPAEGVEVAKDTLSAGQAVDVLVAGEATVLVRR
jgi:valyl-tRNA synthetase